MTRLLLTALLLAAAPASAQVRVSAGALGGIDRTFDGERTLGGNVAVQWRRLFAQAHIARFSVNDERLVVTLPGGEQQVLEERFVNVSAGLDVHAAQHIAGPLTATLGVGVFRERFERLVVGPIWSTNYRLYAGGLVGQPGRVQLQLQLASEPSSSGLYRREVQVGVLVPVH